MNGASVHSKGAPGRRGAARLMTEKETEFRQLSQAREGSELAK